MLASLLGDKEARMAVVARPSIFLSRQETMKELYDKLEERFGRNDVLSLFHRYPSLLGLSWKSMGPKWKCVVEEMGVDKSQVLACPTALGYSLKKRIRPRLEHVRSTGMLHKYSLGSILTPTDEEFAERFLHVSTELARLYCSPHVSVAELGMPSLYKTEMSDTGQQDDYLVNSSLNMFPDRRALDDPRWS